MARAPRIRRSSRHDHHRHVRQLLRRRAGLDRDARSCTRTSRSARSTTAPTAIGAGTQLRHVFGASNFQYPEIPAALQNVNAYADFPSSSVTVYDDFLRNTITSDLTYYANKWGEHTHQGRVPVRADQQLASRRRPVPDDHAQLGRDARRARRPPGERHLRPLHRDPRLQLGRHPHQRRRPLPAGRVDPRDATSR